MMAEQTSETETTAQAQRFPITPFPGNPKVSTQRWILLFVIFAGLFYMKWTHNHGTSALNTDGELYTHLAQNVRDGLGLVTNVSLYNKGFSYFPHETNIYPLWPLLLGYVSKIIDIDFASRWLPTLFYFLSLTFLYLGVRRISDHRVIPEVWPVLDVGHIAVLMFGTAKHFFIHTSLPYTEGMAYFLLFASIYFAYSAFKTPTLWRALLVGALAGFTFMTRTQLLILFLALVSGAIFAVFMARNRKPWVLTLLGLVSGFALSITPWWLHLSTFIPDLAFTHMLRFDFYRETDFLPVAKMLKTTDGLWDFILDRAEGIPKAFGGWGRHSYFNNWNMMYQASFFAIPLALFEGARALMKGKGQEIWAALRDPKNFYLTFLFFLSMAGIVSIHLIHKIAFAEWNFATRHALTTFFFFFACVYFLIRRPVLPRLWVVMVILLGVYGNVQKIGHFSPKKRAALKKAAQPFQPELMAWINTQKDAQPPGETLIIAATDGRTYAKLTTGIGFHDLSKKTSIRTLQAMSVKLKTDYVIVKQKRKHDFQKVEKTFTAVFEQVASDLNGHDVYKMKDGVRIMPMRKYRPGKRPPGSLRRMKSGPIPIDKPPEE